METGQEYDPREHWREVWPIVRRQPTLSHGAKLCFAILTETAGGPAPTVVELAAELNVKPRQGAEYLAELRKGGQILPENSRVSRRLVYRFFWPEPCTTAQGSTMHYSASMQSTALHHSASMHHSAWSGEACDPPSPPPLSPPAPPSLCPPISPRQVDIYSATAVPALPAPPAANFSERGTPRAEALPVTPVSKPQAAASAPSQTAPETPPVVPTPPPRLKGDDGRQMCDAALVSYGGNRKGWDVDLARIVRIHEENGDPVDRPTLVEAAKRGYDAYQAERRKNESLPTYPISLNCLTDALTALLADQRRERAEAAYQARIRAEARADRDRRRAEDEQAKQGITWEQRRDRAFLAGPDSPEWEEATYGTQTMRQIMRKQYAAWQAAGGSGAATC